MSDTATIDSAAIDPAKTHQVLEHKHERPLVACRFDPTGRYVFFGAEDNLVHRLDLQSKAVTPLAAHDSWVRAIGFSPDGTTLFSGGYDGRLIWWNTTDEQPWPIRTVEAHHGWLRAVAVSPGGDLIASCGNDNLVKLWNAADGQPVAELAGHASHVYNVAFHPTSETLVSCDLKGNVKEWEVVGRTLKRDLTAAAALYKYDTSFRADIGGARSLTFSSDGKQLGLGGITNVTNAFAGIGNATVVVLDLEQNKVARQLETKEKVNGLTWGLAHHPQDFWIGLGGGGGGGWIYFWNKDSTAEFFKLKLPNDGRDLSLAPDRRRIAVAHADKTLRLYALNEKQP
jgi:WD40 repeat protein